MYNHMETKSQENKKLSEYKKKLRDIRKLYEAVKTFSDTNEKYRSQTFIKIGGCGTFISIMALDFNGSGSHRHNLTDTYHRLLIEVIL